MNGLIAFNYCGNRHEYKIWNMGEEIISLLKEGDFLDIKNIGRLEIFYINDATFRVMQDTGDTEYEYKVHCRIVQIGELPNV